MHVHFDLAIIEQPALFAAWLVYTALLCLIYYACLVKRGKPAYVGNQNAYVCENNILLWLVPKLPAL